MNQDEFSSLCRTGDLEAVKRAVAQNEKQKNSLSGLFSSRFDLNRPDSNRRLPLDEAADSGNSELMLFLVQQGASKIRASNRELFNAAKEGRLKDVRELIGRGARVNWEDSRAQNSLMVAAERGHTAIVKLLLKEGAEVNAKDDNHRTALIYAAGGGHLPIVRVLLKAGANVNAWTGFRDTALTRAARGGHTAVVRLLIASGADVTFDTNGITAKGYTALFDAAMMGHVDVARLLVKHGADVNLWAKAWGGGDTPLTKAAAMGNVKMVEFLVRNGAELEGGYHGTALACAADLKQTGTAQRLIELGADFNSRGCTVGDRAEFIDAVLESMGRHEDVAARQRTHEQLLSEDQEPTEDGGAETAADALLAAVEEGDTDEVAALLAKGAPVNATSRDGDIALIRAAARGRTAIVRMLLDSGANTEARTSLEETALTAVVMNSSNISREHTETVKVLLAHGAKVNVANRDGTTPLMRAASKGNSDALEMLLAQGANIHAADKYGGTALSHAARKGKVLCARLLIEHGANLFVKDTTGFTALTVAKKAGHTPMVDLLSEAMGCPARP